MSINNRELFSEWLNCKSINKPPINLILLAFDEVSEFAISRKLSKVGIWSISSQSDFKFVRVAVSKNQILRVVHNEAHKAVDDKEIVAEASLKIAEDNYSVVATDVHVEKHSNVNQADELQNYDYDPSTILTFTKPELVMYFGAIDSNVASWRDVYKSVINSLCED